MGGRQSRPSPPPPPVVIEEPYPTVDSADGISLSQATMCNDCQLEVDTKITSSNVKLLRELGDISSTQCQRYNQDMERVKKNYMSLADFLQNLQSGQYAKGVAEEPASGSRPAQGYCETVGITDESAAAIKNIDEVESKLTRGRIRKVSGSGDFSAGTKARFIPSIPFKMSFKGKKVVQVGNKTRSQAFDTPFTVTQITLYYPSPIRIDSVQADAMLALNDPSDPGANFIVLIPLKATNTGEKSADFVGKIAKFIPMVSQYDAASGTYPTKDIQTGAGWALGNIFTLGEEKNGLSTVKNGFFTWTGVAGYERVKTVNTATEIRYTWRPRIGLSAPQYFLLDTPLDIDSADLGTITNGLTMTPSAEANHPIPPNPLLVFHKGSVPPAPDTLSGTTSGGSSCGIGNLCEGMVDYTAQPNWGKVGNQLGMASDVLKGEYSEVLDDPFEKSCPGARCDPFLQNAIRNNKNTSLFTPRNMFTLFFNLMVLIAMLIGAYVAMNMVGNDYDLNLRNLAEQIGKVMAVWAKSISNKTPSISMPTIENSLSGLSAKFPGATSKFSNILASKKGLTAQ